MDRIEFVKKASKYFNTPLDNDYQGLMRFDIKGQEAEKLRIINKDTGQLLPPNQQVDYGRSLKTLKSRNNRKKGFSSH